MNLWRLGREEITKIANRPWFENLCYDTTVRSIKMRVILFRSAQSREMVRHQMRRLLSSKSRISDRQRSAQSGVTQLRTIERQWCVKLLYNSLPSLAPHDMILMALWSSRDQYKVVLSRRSDKTSLLIPLYVTPCDVFILRPSILLAIFHLHFARISSTRLCHSWECYRCRKCDDWGQWCLGDQSVDPQSQDLSYDGHSHGFDIWFFHAYLKRYSENNKAHNSI